jgi:hypothetical protein
MKIALEDPRLGGIQLRALTAEGQLTSIETSSPATTGEFTPPINTNVFADISKVRVSHGGLMVGTREIVSKIPVRKPARQEFYRVRVGEEWSLVTYAFEDKDTREIYFVPPEMVRSVFALGELLTVKLVPAVTKQGVTLLIPAKLPSEGTSMTGWHETMLVAIERAKTSWIRVSADMALGGYRVFAAVGDLGEPEFPDMSLSEMLEIAFKGRVIDSEDHPVFRKLVGRM